MSFFSSLFSWFSKARRRERLNREWPSHAHSGHRAADPKDGIPMDPDAPHKPS